MDDVQVYSQVAVYTVGSGRTMMEACLAGWQTVLFCAVLSVLFLSALATPSAVHLHPWWCVSQVLMSVPQKVRSLL